MKKYLIASLFALCLIATTVCGIWARSEELLRNDPSWMQKCFLGIGLGTGFGILTIILLRNLCKSIDSSKASQPSN